MRGTRSRYPGSYPARFVEIAQQVGGYSLTIRVPAAGPIPDGPQLRRDGQVLTGADKARRVASMFYAFRSSLRLERIMGSRQWTETANWCEQVLCTVDTVECCLWFSPRSETWQFQLMETAGAARSPTASRREDQHEAIVWFQKMLEGET